MMSGSTTQRIGFEPLLADLARHGELVHMETVAARSARFASLSSVGVEVPAPVRSGLGLDLSALWSHQVDAIGQVMAGRNVVVATGTASGKSLCYQLPIALATASEGRRAHAPTSLLLFPTKALAQDQLRALGALGCPAWCLSPTTVTVPPTLGCGPVAMPRVCSPTRTCCIKDCCPTTGAGRRF